MEIEFLNPLYNFGQDYEGFLWIPRGFGHIY